VEDRYHLTDDKLDILSHPRRRSQIHVLTVDPVLGTDIHERMLADERLKRYWVLRPEAAGVRDALEELERMAKDTVESRLLIFDVRRVTLARLRRAFNAIVGYNRRDFNTLCYTICIGDGPVTLFQNGHDLDVFNSFLSSNRVDYYPSVFFFDPFLHYEPDELETRGIDEEFLIPDEAPRRLLRHLNRSGGVKLDTLRRFFRAADKDDEVRQRRRRMLRRLLKRQLAEQFPGEQERIRRLMSRKGVRLATEKLNLYPLYFEDWVHRLMRSARENAARGAGGA